MKRGTIPAKVDSSETHTKRRLKRRLTAWAKVQKEEKNRSSKLEADRQREAKLRGPNKLRKATGHLETGLGLLLEVLRSDNLPMHKVGDLHSDYFTSDAITALARHGEQIIVELCKLAKRGEQDAIQQVWESGSLLAKTVQGIAETNPKRLGRVAPLAEAMPVLWHRKEHRKGHRKVSENDKLFNIADRIELGCKLSWHLDGKSQHNATNTKLVRRWMKRWLEIEGNLRWRRRCAKRHKERVPDLEHLRLACKAGVLTRTETRLFGIGLELEPPIKGNRKAAQPWASKVLVPWLRANKKKRWVKKLVSDGKFDSPSAFAQILAGLVRS